MTIRPDFFYESFYGNIHVEKRTLRGAEWHILILTFAPDAFVCTPQHAVSPNDLSWSHFELYQSKAVAKGETSPPCALV